MNKIIRFASVVAIACASLVYAGCTKDFSSDIARLEGEKATKADVEKVNAALEAFKTEATAQLADLAAKKADKTTVEALQSKVADLEPIVTANKSNIATLTTAVGQITAIAQAFQVQYVADMSAINQAISDNKAAAEAALATAVEKLNDKDAELSKKDTELNQAIDTLDAYVKKVIAAAEKEYRDLNAKQQAEIDTLIAQVGRLDARVSDLESAVATLQSQMSQVLAMVQSLSFIPDKEGQAPVAYTFVEEKVTPRVTGLQTAPVVAKAVFQTSFQVTPEDAAKNINVENLKIRVVGTTEAKAFATEANDTLIKVTSVKVNGKTGYIDVIGAFDWTIKGSEDATLSVVAIYARDGENQFKENISTSVFPIEVNQDTTKISHVFAVNGKAVREFAADEIVVTPSTEGDLKKAIFGDASKYEIYAQAVLGEKDTLVGPLDTIAALIGADVDFVKPAKGDTTYRSLSDTWCITDVKKFKIDTNYFATKVDPDTTVLDILKASKNAEVVYTGSISICNGSKVTGNYVIKPDEVKDDKGNIATIAWNWNKATKPLKDSIVILGIMPNDVDKFTKVGGDDYYKKEIKVTDKAGKVVDATCRISWVDSKTFNATVYSNTIEYGMADSTYVVTITNKEIPGTIYTLAFEFTVKARPANTVLDFGVCDTLVLDDISQNLVIKNDFSKKLFQYINSQNDVTIAAAKKDSVIAKAALAPVTTKSYIATDSTVVLAKDLKYAKDIVIKDTLATAYGFKVAVQHTIKINAPVLTLNPVKEYVKDYVVEVKSRNENGKYTIDHMPFQQYLTVKGNEKGYAVKAKIHADSSQVVNGSATLKLASGKNDIFESNVMKWGTLNTTSFKLGVALVTKDEKAVLDTATIKFWTKDPLSPMTARDTAVVQKIGDSTTVALNSNKIIALTGLDNENVIMDNGVLLNNYSLSNLQFKIVEYSSDEAKNFASIKGNTFTLDQNHGTLTGPATFKIKATVDYIFGKKEATFTVTINPAK